MWPRGHDSRLLLWQLWPLHSHPRRICFPRKSAEAVQAGRSTPETVGRSLLELPREISIFDRARGGGPGAPLHQRVTEDREDLEEKQFPGRGNKRAVFEAALLRRVRAHLRGTNTEALPEAKFERAQREAASKAPENLPAAARGRGRPLGDDADACSAEGAAAKPRAPRRVRPGPVTIPASGGHRKPGSDRKSGEPQRPRGPASKLIEEVLRQR
mmetsp:Transcript_5996/g.16367  ORF Transcript_5996/g.16367 Transcript_5996/m.16367 type:complete len:214 (-) Transcript_5996:27-668(-)